MSPHVTDTAPALPPSAPCTPGSAPSPHATRPAPCHVHHTVASPVRSSLGACAHLPARCACPHPPAPT
eukprot:3416324-Prymnesium_polylepis.1